MTYNYSNNLIKNIYGIYISYILLCLNSRSYIECFYVFLDVSLCADCLQGVREQVNADIISNSFSEKNINTTLAHKLFPCHNLTTERSKFDEWKSSVPLKPLSTDRVKVESVFQREALVRKQYPKGIVPRVSVSVSSTKHTLNTI